MNVFIALKGTQFLFLLFILGPDVIHKTKTHKKFGSHNGSLTQSMHHSEDKNQIDHYDETKKSTHG